MIYKFSDKRTYTIVYGGNPNKQIIHVNKVKNSPDKSDQEIFFTKFLSQGRKVEQTIKVSEMELVEVIQHLTSTEFFTMHFTYKGWKTRDKEFADELAIKIANTLLQRGIELVGTGKFEEYDTSRLLNFMCDMNEIDESKSSAIFHKLISEDLTQWWED